MNIQDHLAEILLSLEELERADREREERRREQQDIWNYEERQADTQTEAFEKIEAVWDAIRNEVADKLIAADERNEFKHVASAIRDNELASYLDW